MLNDHFRLVSGGSTGTLGVAWTAHADDAVSQVFINGRLEAEAFAPGRAERAIDVPWPPGGARVVEIHDFDPADVSDALPVAITLPPETFTRPVLHFSTTPDAVRYRIYHRPEYGAETRLADIDARAFEGPWADFPCDDMLDGHALAGVWHYFRVEAVSAFGVESRRHTWAWRAVDTPNATAVRVAAGSVPGLYDLSIHPAIHPL